MPHVPELDLKRKMTRMDTQQRVDQDRQTLGNSSMKNRNAAMRMIGHAAGNTPAGGIHNQRRQKAQQTLGGAPMATRFAAMREMARKKGLLKQAPPPTQREQDLQAMGATPMNQRFAFMREMGRQQGRLPEQQPGGGQQGGPPQITATPGSRDYGAQAQRVRAWHQQQAQEQQGGGQPTPEGGWGWNGGSGMQPNQIGAGKMGWGGGQMGGSTVMGGGSDKWDGGKFYPGGAPQRGGQMYGGQQMQQQNPYALNVNSFQQPQNPYQSNVQNTFNPGAYQSSFNPANTFNPWVQNDATGGMQRQMGQALANIGAGSPNSSQVMGSLYGATQGGMNQARSIAQGQQTGQANYNNFINQPTAFDAPIQQVESRIRDAQAAGDTNALKGLTRDLQSLQNQQSSTQNARRAQAGPMNSGMSGLLGGSYNPYGNMNAPYAAGGFIRMNPTMNNNMPGYGGYKPDNGYGGYGVMGGWQ